MKRRVAARMTALIMLAMAVESRGATPLDARIVVPMNPIHLSSPDESVTAQGWETLAPLTRFARLHPPEDVFLLEIKRWAMSQGRAVSSGSTHNTSKSGLDALDLSRAIFRSGPRTAEQLAVWRRIELPPDAASITVRYAVLSYANDRGVKDTKFTLEWRGAPIAGADAAARISRLVAADAAEFLALLAAADAELIAAFERARLQTTPPGARGRLDGVRGELNLIGGDDARVLAVGTDKDLYSAPRAHWRPGPNP